MAVPGNSVANSAVLFREVHKNAWLRRLPTEEKKIGAHSKKGERVWCVFCVHDDVEPFIEIYADQKVAAAHKPDWCASLSHTLHVSPTICARDDEFEFVVTLPDTALRLSAPSWEVMMEWVESIGGKLREMHVLSPRENLYSRQPESRAPLLPTRDPNSPLPPPPASVPPMLVPGVEALTLNTPTPQLHPDSQNITVIQVDPIDYQPSTAETSSGLITTLINCDDDDVDEDNTFNDDEDSLDDEQDVFGEDVASVCPPLPRLPCQLNRTNHSCDRNRNSQNNCNNSSQLIGVEGGPTTSNHRSSNNSQLIGVEGAPSTSNHRSSNNTQLIGVEGAPTTSNHRSSNNTQLNNQLIGVEGAPTTSNHRSSNNTQLNNQLIGVEGAPSTSSHRSTNNTQLNNQLIGVEVAPTVPNHRSSNNTQLNNQLIGVEGAPTVPNHRSSNNTQLNNQLIGVEGAPTTSNHRGSNSTQLTSQLIGVPTVPNHRSGNNSQVIGVEGAPSPSNNRNTQLTSQLIEVEGAATDSPATSNQSSHRGSSRSRTVNDSGHTTRQPAADSASDNRAEPPASPVLYEHVFLASSPASPPPPPAEDASSSSSPPPLSADLRYSQVQDRVVPPVNAIRPRSGLRPNRRRSSDSSVPADRIRRLQAPPHPFRQPVAAVEAGAGVTLRERQVQQLRREMTHQGGVRLQLRRKDCLGSIALVDAFGAIWVAGWKQKEHPMLYNALHIGDKVISVAGVRVQSSCDAHKLIRGAPSLYVAVVIRRVPFGRALALRRESEGQSVGVVQEGGTAEIREVVAGGLAAQQGGLPPRAPSVERPGQLTTWCLTEINGRPLNLFFKENEVRDRLNAVGLDISFLVQPTDLVKQIRRQLKALRGYKDYIVQ